MIASRRCAREQALLAGMVPDRGVSGASGDVSAGDIPLHKLFEEQARRPPEAPAVEDPNTYDDANLRSALEGTGLQRSEVNAELFTLYARNFADQGWAPAPSRVVPAGARNDG